MTLTTQLRHLHSGRWKVSFQELPGVYYVDDRKADVLERAERLQHALRSEHVHVEAILPDGDVILALYRSDDGGRLMMGMYTTEARA